MSRDLRDFSLAFSTPPRFTCFVSQVRKSRKAAFSFLALTTFHRVARYVYPLPHPDDPEQNEEVC